jgi:hypothetical protein
MAEARYPIRIDPRFGWLLRLWGATPEHSYVDVSDELHARFGRIRFRVPISDIVRWRIEGPFRRITALGVRLSIRGGDVTFGGSAHGGVRVDFRESVRWGLLHVPALYVSADDLEGLAAELERRGIPGVDARRDSS